MFENIARPIKSGFNSALEALNNSCSLLTGFFSSQSKVDSNVCAIGLSHMEIYRRAEIIIQQGSCEFPVLRVPTAVQRENQKQLLPILALALEGDVAMQADYCARRLVHMSYMPAWVEDQCYQLAHKQFQKFRIQDYLTSSARREGYHFEVQIAINSDQFERLLFNQFATTYDRQLFLKEAQHNHFNGRYRDTTEMIFSPISNDPMGNLARSVFKVCTEYMNAAQIALDILAYLKVDLSGEQIKNVILPYKDKPWDMVNHSVFTRMFTLDEMLRSHNISLDNGRRSALFLKCLNEDPKRIISAVLPKQEVVTEEASVKQPVSPTKPSEIKQSATKEAFTNIIIDAIQAKIKSSQCENPREVAREIYKVVKRGDLELKKVLDALGRGLAPEELLERAAADRVEEGPDIYQLVLNRVKKEARSINQTPFVPKEANQVDIAESVVAWINDLRDMRDRDRVTTRLERLKEGNLGNFNRVRGGIIELKELDLRIYMRQVELNHFKVIHAGDKSTQDKDIEDCQKL